MMKLMLCLIFASFVIFQANAEYSGYGYSCIKVKAPAVCPNADSFIKGLNASLLEPIYKAIEESLGKVGNNDVPPKCRDALKKFLCLLVPQCKSARQLLYIDFDNVNTQCNKLDQTCSASGVCEGLQGVISNLKQVIKFKCVSVQDKSGYCPNVDYKVVQFGDSPSEIEGNVNDLKMALQKHQANITKNCSNTVKTFGCFLTRGPICSDDGSYFMSPISKQECVDKLKCLPVSYNKDGEKAFPHATCDFLPDAGSTRVPNPSGIPEALGGPDNHGLKTQAVTFMSLVITMACALLLL